MLTGIFPAQWMLSNVILIPRSGDLEEPHNKGHSRPRHLQGRRGNTGLLDKLVFFSLWASMIRPTLPIWNLLYFTNYENGKW